MMSNHWCYMTALHHNLKQLESHMRRNSSKELTQEEIDMVARTILMCQSKKKLKEWRSDFVKKVKGWEKLHITSSTWTRRT